MLHTNSKSDSLVRRLRNLLLLMPLATLICDAGAAVRHRSLRPVTPTAPPHRLLVGYFPQWGLYNDNPYTVKTLVERGGAAMLDQLNYAQGFVTGGHCSVADPNADVNYTYTAQTSVDGSSDLPTAPVRGSFHQLMELKRLYPRIKILISLEGRDTDFSADAQPEQRAAFVSSCVDLFLKGNLGAGVSIAGLFDGIDIDWEYPHEAEGANYLPLIAEFRRQMDAVRPGLVLSVALGPSPHMYGDADLASVGNLVDQAGLMTYDFAGPWSKTTGFIAPLSSGIGGEGSVERSVNAWKGAGIPPSKLLVGLPFYGYGWKSVAADNNGLGQNGSAVHGDHPYSYIKSLIDATDKPKPLPDQPVAAPLPTSLTLYRDPQSQAPWLFDGDSFWTFDDPVSIRSKASFVAGEQLGGFMIWELSDDTADAALLKAARQALLRPGPLPGPAPGQSIVGR